MKILPTFLVIIVCVVSCDKNPLLYRHKSVRARIKLEKIEIKSLNETVYFTGGEKPRLWEFGEEKYYVIGYRYRWDESSNNFIIINLTVAGAVELAYEYLNNKRLNCSCPIVCLPSEDHPAIAGDISFGGGRHFIRNNIVIEIDVDGRYSNKILEIAKQVDSLLLKSPLFPSSGLLKPIINKFEISENPVKLESDTKLFIDVNNPLTDQLVYRWIFNPHLGGIYIDNSGDYYFQAYMWDPVNILLTLIIINDSGFCDWSEIEINVVN